MTAAGCAGEHRAEPVAPEIVPREAWADREPVADRLRTQTPRLLTLHHSGVVDQGDVPGDERMRRLLRFSIEQRPWGDVPYHFVIDRQGRIFEARALEHAPDTNTDYDVDGHVGICVNGNLVEQPIEEAQYRALVDLLAYLLVKLDLPESAIDTHMGHAPGQTACPGALERELRDGPLLERIRAVRAGVPCTPAPPSATTAE